MLKKDMSHADAQGVESIQQDQDVLGNVFVFLLGQMDELLTLIKGYYGLFKVKHLWAERLTERLIKLSEHHIPLVNDVRQQI